MIFNILIVLLVILLFIVAMVLFRTLRFSRPFEPVESIEESGTIEPDVIAEHLSNLVHIQTVSQPGAPPNRAALEEIHKVIEKLYPRIHATLRKEVIGDYSLLYTWVGTDPDLDPILLAAHLDVVTVDSETNPSWQHPPFSGQIADGFVWGRGTLDLKNQLVAVLEAVETLLKQKYTPKRTLFLAFGHDEEVGGFRGAKKIAAHLQAQGVELSAVLDEGSFIIVDGLPGAALPVAMVGISEKGLLTLGLEVQGQSGHSSMPPAQTAIGILADALARIEANPMPARISGLGPLLRNIGIAAPFSQQMAFANLWLFRNTLEKRLAGDLQTNALIRTTSAITMIRGGAKDNVLPHKATALVNIRILPPDNIAEVCKHLRKVIADDRVQFVPIDQGTWEAAPLSPINIAYYEELTKTIRQIFGNLPVAPYTAVITTDSRHYSPICKNIYRFSPLLVDKEDIGRIHGINERIGIDTLSQMVGFYLQLVKNWTGEEE